MIIKITIFITLVMHIIAVIISIRLTRKTKYYVSWAFISFGFLFLLFRILIESLPYFIDFDPQEYNVFLLWFSIGASFLFTIGLILIYKIFDYMERMEKEKRADEKKFLSMIIQAEENERARLAKELHDGIGPLLSTVKMSVSALKKDNEQVKEKEIVNNIDKVINESIRSLKDISNNLSPHVIENFGLTKALRNFIKKINSSGILHISLQSNMKDLRLDNNTEIVLYRVICELINNTLKHAYANKISIDLKHNQSNVYVEYKDDGIGFEVDNLFKPQEMGMGFNNINSRINSLKGIIETHSSPGKGTTIKIYIPSENEPN